MTLRVVSVCQLSVGLGEAVVSQTISSCLTIDTKEATVSFLCAKWPPARKCINHERLMKSLSDKCLNSLKLSVRKGKMTHFISHFFAMFEVKLYKYDYSILKFIKQARFLDKKNGG